MLRALIWGRDLRARRIGLASRHQSNRVPRTCLVPKDIVGVVPGAQDLQGYYALQIQVLCFVDERHAALALQREQLIALVKYLSLADHVLAPR